MRIFSFIHANDIWRDLIIGIYKWIDSNEIEDISTSYWYYFWKLIYLQIRNLLRKKFLRIVFYLMEKIFIFLKRTMRRHHFATRSTVHCRNSKLKKYQSIFQKRLKKISKLNPNTVFRIFSENCSHLLHSGHRQNV